MGKVAPKTEEQRAAQNSKKQEARSKKQEARSKKQEGGWQWGCAAAAF
jgi:hypothetical protein